MFSKLLFIFIQISLINSKEKDFFEEIPVVEGNGGQLKIRVEEEVYVLNEENFDLFVFSKKSIILIEFYVDWCHHCRQLESEFSSAAKLLKEDNILLAKVHCNREESLAKRFHITGFPTLIIFRNGTQEEYSGPRTALGIVDYLRQESDPKYRPETDLVLSLGNENFTRIVSKEELMVVMFYSQWCQHCTKLLPEYSRAAKRLQNEILFAKIDFSREKDLNSKFNVSRVPTIFLLRKGKQYSYSGPQEENQIVQYLREAKREPSLELKSLATLNNALKREWPTVVGLFDDNQVFEEFISCAFQERERGFQFFHSFDPKVISSLTEEKNSIIVLIPELFHSKFEPKNYSLKTDHTMDSSMISSFILNSSLPLVGQRTPSNQWLFTTFPLIVVYYDVDFSHEHRIQTQLTRKQVLEVANQYKERITFCVSKEDDYSQELKDLKLDDSGEDINVGFFESNKVRYSMPPTDQFDSQVLKKFVEDVLNGRIGRTLKSQSVPSRNEGPVKTIVGETFDSLVTKSDKNVLIEFYAQWCGHCKTLEPIYRQLGQKYSENKDLIISKIEATLNDFPELYEVKGFPTIYFLRKDSKNWPKLYSGDRSLEDLSNFVESNLNEFREEL